MNVKKMAKYKKKIYTKRGVGGGGENKSARHILVFDKEIKSSTTQHDCLLVKQRF